MPEADDAALVLASRQGDAAAFDQLVRRHLRRALAVAGAILRDPMDAEDVVQDAFVKALERLEECRDPSKFSAWLGQIVRRRALNALDARRVRKAEALEPETAASSSNPALETERRALRAELEAALATLTEPQRTVVLLHDLEGWPHKEIAATIGSSEVMSRQHLFTARKRLRAALGDRRPGA